MSIILYLYDEELLEFVQIIISFWWDLPSGSPCGVMVKVQSELKTHLRYFVHFRTNTIGKGLNPLMFLSNELNSVIAVLVGSCWHEINQEGWYTIKQRNQANIIISSILFYFAVIIRPIIHLSLRITISAILFLFSHIISLELSLFGRIIISSILFLFVHIISPGFSLFINIIVMK